jgi:hypothetical protein
MRERWTPRDTQRKELKGVTKVEWEECRLAGLIHLQKRIQNELHAEANISVQSKFRKNIHRNLNTHGI